MKKEKKRKWKKKKKKMVIMKRKKKKEEEEEEELGKKFRSEMSKREEKFRPDVSVKKNVQVPLRYHKIKTKKLGKKKKIVKGKG